MDYQEEEIGGQTFNVYDEQYVDQIGHELAREEQQLRDSMINQAANSND